MRNLLRITIGFNVIWSTFFFLFQIGMIIYSYNDHKWNVPMTKNQYVDKGGTSFDFYAGYAFVTPNNSVNHSLQDKMSTSITARSYVRYIYLMMYFFLWVYGFYGLFKIQAYYYPSKMDLERSRNSDFQIQEPRSRHYVFGILSTIISLYGVYYTVVYISKFWFE